MKSGNLNFLEHSGPLQACNGADLPLMYKHVVILLTRFGHFKSSPGRHLTKKNIKMIFMIFIIYITSIYQPTNAHTISHKTLLNILKYSDMFRSCQIIIRELCSLLKLCYSIHNSIGICRRGEYCNITLARNKAPWWWSDKIETCRSVLSVLCEIICAFVSW